MDIGEATAFDDPLGIAMSWEEKYKKKGAESDGTSSADPPAAGEATAPATAASEPQIAAAGDATEKAS
jgi:hypothetical protein